MWGLCVWALYVNNNVIGGGIYCFEKIFVLEKDYLSIYQGWKAEFRIGERVNNHLT